MAYVLTVERSFTLEVRIAVFTAMSHSWRFIRHNGYFNLPVVLLPSKAAKTVSINARGVPTWRSDKKRNAVLPLYETGRRAEIWYALHVRAFFV